MTIDISNSIEQQLRGIAQREGRDVGAVLEEAIRLYVEAASITDLDPDDVAETQVALAGDLSGIPSWESTNQ